MTLGERSRWTVRQYAFRSSVDGAEAVTRLGPAAVERALDTTVFEADAGRFSECERYRDRSGRNLHPAPITLPREVVRGVAYRPIPGFDATVTLTHAGPVRLRLGERTEVARALCLLASEGGQEREQWMVEGIGEVALGAPGRFERWMLGFSSASGRHLFGGAGAPFSSAVLPELPAVVDTTARSSLY